MKRYFTKESIQILTWFAMVTIGKAMLLATRIFYTSSNRILSLLLLNSTQNIPSFHISGEIMQISYLLAIVTVISKVALPLLILMQQISSFTWQQFLQNGNKENDIGTWDSAVELSCHYHGIVKSVLICQQEHVHYWGSMTKTELPILYQLGN